MRNCMPYERSRRCGMCHVVRHTTRDERKRRPVFHRRARYEYSFRCRFAIGCWHECVFASVRQCAIAKSTTVMSISVCCTNECATNAVQRVWTLYIRVFTRVRVRDRIRCRLQYAVCACVHRRGTTSRFCNTVANTAAWILTLTFALRRCCCGCKFANGLKQFVVCDFGARNAFLNAANKYKQDNHTYNYTNADCDPNIGF